MQPSRRPLPADWRTPELILLVGGNPLPNYLAARLLLADQGRVHLIHSAATQPIAERIASVLGSTGVTCRRHEVTDPADGGRIRSSVERALAECTHSTVGLNYTGGTKAMSVHAYEAGMAASGVTIVPTYLDAQSLHLYRSDTGKRWPVQFLVEPSLDTLLSLQDTPVREKRIQTEVKHSVFNQRIAAAFRQPHVVKGYGAWCGQYLRNNGKLVEEVRHLPQDPIGLPGEPEMEPVADALRELFNISGDSITTHEMEEIAKQERFGGLEYLVKHLDGDWVEHLTLAAFQVLTKECQLHGVSMTLDTDENVSQYNFEFDVVALQGYRLFAVSCTRDSTSSRCKSKLFEAYVRARQLGGDEARVGLVCAHPSPRNLQSELEDTWRTDSGQIRVFGADDMSRLADAFYDWLNKQPG